ncbi:hypothetical protein KC960_02155 [Candidatus Saccharibacteria bacterium]|nr:hypothetical protein [Candidatus Saccharibacteria bacterium]
MFKLDDNFLIELGLGALPPTEKNKMLAHIYETLEMRVGMRLAEKMSNEQLDEFEAFINNNDEAGALKWLETNFPNYKQVVAEELEKLKSEIKQAAPAIVEQALAQSAQQQPIAPTMQQPPLTPVEQTQPVAQPLSPNLANPNPAQTTDTFQQAQVSTTQAQYSQQQTQGTQYAQPQQQFSQPTAAPNMVTPQQQPLQPAQPVNPVTTIQQPQQSFNQQAPMGYGTPVQNAQQPPANQQFNNTNSNQPATNGVNENTSDSNAPVQPQPWNPNI